MQYKHRWGYKTPRRTKLDSLYSDEDKENNKPVSENIINEDDCVSLSEDIEDVVFDRKLSCLHILVTLTLISLHLIKSQRWESKVKEKWRNYTEFTTAK